MLKEKSYVGMAHKLCPICGVKHDEVVLVDKRLRNTLPRDQFAGYALCPEHAKMSDEYMTLIELDGNPDKNGRFTGNIAHVKWDAAARIFDAPMSRSRPFAFIEVGVIEKLMSMQEES